MSLLPRNVAMEMKEDFLKPPERIFHKIYIQRHDNVRYRNNKRECVSTTKPFMLKTHTYSIVFFPDYTDSVNSIVLKLWLRILNQWVNKSQQLFTHTQSSKFLSLAAYQSSHRMYGAHSASAINSRAAQLTHTAPTRRETESERWNKAVLGGKFTQ